MDILVFTLPFIFTMLFGLFDGAQTIRKDAPDQSIFWKHSEKEWMELGGQVFKEEFRDSTRKGLTKFTKFDLWYYGSNTWYPPHIQTGMFHIAEEGKCPDFWHQMKTGWTWCIPLIAGSAALSVHLNGGLGWEHSSYLMLAGIEGYTFNWSYKWLWRKNREPLWNWVKNNIISHPKY